MALLSGDAHESPLDTDTFGYIDPQRDVLLEQVNPGVTREGEVIFTVAPNASDFRLRVGDARAFSNENAFVDLGF